MSKIDYYKIALDKAKEWDMMQFLTQENVMGGITLV